MGDITLISMIKDCEHLANLFQVAEDLESFKEVFYSLPNIKNINSIIKLYNNNYDFTNDELKNLLDDLDFLRSGRINEILIISKYNNILTNNKYLFDDYNKIIFQKTLFKTFIYYDLSNPLNFLFSNKDCFFDNIKICIENDSINSFLFLIGKEKNVSDYNIFFLELIVRQNGTKILEYLISTNIEMSDIESDNILNKAVKKRNYKFLKLLLENGFKPFDYSTLINQAYSEHLGEYFKNPSVEKRRKCIEEIPVIEKTLKVILTFLKEENSLESLKNDLNDILKFAVKNNLYELAKLLLENGANVHISEGYCIIWACTNGSNVNSLEMIKLLLEYNADIYAGNDWCIKQSRKNGHMEVVKLLIEHDKKIKRKYETIHK